MSQFVNINELTIAFNNEEPVVNQVNIHINKGEKVAIVGESGSGKTLTSLSLLGLLPDTSQNGLSGNIQISLDGEAIDLFSLSTQSLNEIRGRKIAMIFQEPMSSLDPVYKCGYQVDEAYLTHIEKNKSQAKSRTLDLFKLVQLDEPDRIYNSYPHEISGGQIQRVMIAMALMCEPSLLIADEPTTALDVTIQQEIITLLKKLSDELGMALLFISHDLALVSQVSDRVYVMYKGKIVEEGSTQEVFSKPSNLYTKALLECHPSLEKRDHPLATVSNVMEGKPTDKLKPIERIYSDAEVLKIRNVSKTYYKKKFLGLSKSPSTKALKEVSLSLHKNEILGIVGESGSGKSTLVKCILGVEKADSGQIIFENLDLVQLSERNWKPLRKRIQIIFQDPYSSLNPKMKIGNAIREALKVSGYNGEPKSRVIELLEQVNLSSDYYDRFPSQLSGGQRQRVCIARALAMEPEILLCDESVSALDVSVQAQVLNLLLELRYSENLSIIFITHDFAVVSYLCDRIIVMQHGSIVEEGQPHEILKESKDPYTQRLIESIPTFRKG